MKHTITLALAALAVSVAAHAAEPPAGENAWKELGVILRWEGVIDGHDLLILQGENVTLVHLGDGEPRDVRATSERSLSDEKPERLIIQKLKGRGRVELITQPCAENGYIAVIEITDHGGGADEYSFIVMSVDSMLDATRGRRLLEWEAHVDGRDLLMLQGDKVMVCHLDAQEPKVLMSKLVRPLATDREERIQVLTIEGRGTVRVVQQPSEENNYLAIVEINDPEAGDADYMLVLASEAKGPAQNKHEEAAE